MTLIYSEISLRQNMKLSDIMERVQSALTCDEQHLRDLKSAFQELKSSLSAGIQRMDDRVTEVGGTLLDENRKDGPIRASFVIFST